MSPAGPLSKNLDLTSEPEAAVSDYINLLHTFPYRPTMFIGLGGTGCQAVGKIKRLLGEMFATAGGGQDGRADAIPPFYVFRAFDTSVGECPDGLTVTEWQPLEIANTKKALERARSHPYFAGWLPSDIPLDAIRGGCQGFRTLGRFALGVGIDKFDSKVQSGLRELQTNDPRVVNNSPLIMVFCSLSGGTESGMLLDVGFYLRQNAPEASEVLAVIAYTEGFATMAADQRQRLRAGTFAALKELDAFMNDRFAEANVQQGTVFEFPRNAVTGRWTRPFSLMILVSEKNAIERLTLPQPAHISSYMARFSFQIVSTFVGAGAGGNTPDFWGAFSNRRAAVAAGRARFMFAGLAQVHFPIGDVVDVLCLQTAKEFLRYVSEGNADKTNTKEADAYVADCGLAWSALKEAVLHRGKEIAGPDKFESVIDVLADKKRRYAQKKAILERGDTMGEKRVAQIKERIGATAASISANAQERLDTEVRRYLVTSTHRYLGVRDFLEDLDVVLSEQIKQIDLARQRQVQGSFDRIMQEWKSLRPDLDDVTTRTGPIDAGIDQFRVGSVKVRYLTFLTQSEVACFGMAQFQVTGDVLREVLAKVRVLHQKLEALFTVTIPAASSKIEARREKVASDLRSQELGGAPDERDIMSFAVLNQEWREKMLARHTELHPAALLETVQKDGWNPLAWIDVKSDAKKGLGIETVIASDVVARIDPYFSSLRRRDIASTIADVEDLRGKKPVEALADRLIGMSHVQAPIGGHEALDTVPQAMGFVAGLSSEIVDEMKQGARGGDFSHLYHVEHFEARRITYFSVFLPGSIAGLTNLETVHEPVYDSWLAALESGGSGRDATAQRRTEISLIHAYPMSHLWRSPMKTETAGVTAIEAFARAMAISCAVNFDDFDFDSGKPDDQTAMHAVSKTPKAKGYGIFRFGKSDFWLMPYFTPGKAAAELKGAPIRLGANLFAASRAISDDPEKLAHARRWVAWFDEKFAGSAISGDEARTRIEKGIAELREDYGASADERVSHTWSMVQPALEGWHAS